MNIKDYFSFTRGEKRGTVVLLLIIVGLIITRFSIGLFKQKYQTDFSEFESEIKAFDSELNFKTKSNIQTNSTAFFEFNPNTISNEEWKQLGFKPWQIKSINNYKSKGGKWKIKNDVSKIYGLEQAHYKQLKSFILLPDNLSKKEKKTLIKYFKFNPNTASKKEWQQLGFKDWQIKAIFNYKSKQGSWKTKSDVAKIYGLTEPVYNKLKPYILLPDDIDLSTIKKKFGIKVNINNASIEEIMTLKGVNSEKYAIIISDYRDKLGGFINKKQLKEVWNLNQKTYDELKDQIVIDDKEIKKISVNTNNIEKLKDHPYINWKTANAIYKYAKANGPYKNLEELKKIHLISDETYLKVLPYLKITP